MLVTTTLVKSPDDVRAQLALKTCLTAGELGYSLVVVDGGSSTLFRGLLTDTGALVVPQQEPGMGASRRQALNIALTLGADVIVAFEPEKHTLVPLLGPCLEPLLNGDADMVIPRRKSLDSYPEYQRWSERAGNEVLGKILGRQDLDMFFGPRIMNATVAAHMATYNGQCGLNTYGDNWEIMYVPVLQLLRQSSVRIRSVVVDYHHPPEQFCEEDDPAMRQKRDTQRAVITEAMAREAERLGACL